MKYMGSKNRIAKEILPIMLKDRDNRTWVEPFVGGANMIDKVDGKRIGADINPFLIEALKLIRDTPTEIPELITENDYQEARDKKELNGITGFIGFAMSFGGKWFGGYRRDVAGTKGCIDNMTTQTKRSRQNAIKQSKNIQGVDFISKSYSNLQIPENSIIYCDPPYEGTTKYKDAFDHAEFWQWCREMRDRGHIVFVSEYNAPEDFKCVWSKKITNSMSTTNTKKPTERLFTI